MTARGRIAELLFSAGVIFVLVIGQGCRSPLPCSQHGNVSQALVERTGSEIGPGCGLAGGSLPYRVTLADGITEEEAVEAALWNNAALHELFAQLGVSRAQLYAAGLITDPQFVLFLPVGPKQLEFSAFQAVDAIWLRPIRQRAAELDLYELAQQMIQNGLNTARDARQSHANLFLAQERAELTGEASQLRNRIADLATRRLEAGDISELEVTATRIDALQAEATAAGAVQDLRLAQEQLRVIMGVPIPPQELRAVQREFGPLPVDDKETLVAMAHAMRPDLRAIEIRKASAIRRADLARKQFMLLDAVYDANGDGDEGFESGPGLRFTLPLFNGNRGGISIADALVRQVDRQYATLRDQIELDVRTAVTRLEQAVEQQQWIDERILPALAEAQELSQRNYEDGGVPYFLVLQTTTQYVDAQLRRAATTAAVSQAFADLERSVGRRIAEPDPRPDAEIPLEVEPIVLGGDFAPVEVCEL